MQRLRNFDNSLSMQVGYQMGQELGVCRALADGGWRKGAGRGDPNLISGLRGIAGIPKCWTGSEELGADPPPT